MINLDKKIHFLLKKKNAFKILQYFQGLRLKQQQKHIFISIDIGNLRYFCLLSGDKSAPLKRAKNFKSVDYVQNQILAARMYNLTLYCKQ
jgi:hypothetical protein